MKETNLLFVYGTLTKGFDNPVARHLHNTQHFLGEAWFHGILFEVSFYPGAVYLPKADSKVYGHLFKIIQNRKELFQKLDVYEGIGSNYSQPNEFKREIIPVFFEGDEKSAHTYLYNSSYQQFPVIKSGRFSKET